MQKLKDYLRVFTVVFHNLNISFQKHDAELCYGNMMSLFVFIRKLDHREQHLMIPSKTRTHFPFSIFYSFKFSCLDFIGLFFFK